MNDLKDTKSEISITINKATDIYVLKKEDLIKYCKLKKLNSADTTNNLENTTVPFEGNKPDENNKKNILNQPSYTRNTQNMFNQGSENKNMVIKPDSFSGQGDIKLFFKQYEKAAEVNNWDNKEKIKFLSIFLKDTANTFLENLENIREDWTWEDLKNEFLRYSILLKNKLENRRQENSESTTSYITDIENLCRQD
ncbi:hypothetical protein AGLY_018139 [Aphis glycines]|uniref:Retrotransposon gag domain-containing protein n=1 Tax=Aphis glycines TaxID=307491 RepID=A0A6G0STP3_APHGL|nr:hypothetical protein AGLY_018139 [Aphis glycines]